MRILDTPIAKEELIKTSSNFDPVRMQRYYDGFTMIEQLSAAF